jgi:hypothetical protein
MTKSAALAPLVLASAALLLLGSCASSKGGSYSKAASSESAVAARARGGDTGHDETMEAAPEEEEEEPEVPTGRLVLFGFEEGSSVYVDGAYASDSSRLELETGAHEIRVRRFGFEDFEAAVDIAEEAESVLELEYVAARFRIESLAANPPSFNPEDPGRLGTCAASIEASAPGGGRASVRDSGDSVLRDLGPVEFRERNSSIRWDGLGNDGEALPSGSYFIIVEGAAPDGSTDSARTEVRIARGDRQRASSLYSGVSGALFAPDARAIPAGTFEASAGMEAHLGGAGSGLATPHAGFRLGLPGSAGSEIALSYMSLLWGGDEGANSYSLVAAWKRILGPASDSPWSTALYIKAGLARYFAQAPESSIIPPYDGATRYAGVSLGLPVEFAAGRFRAFASPEIEASSYYPNWYADGYDGTAAIFGWAYLRLGFEALAGDFTLCFSGAPRSAPFGDGLGLSYPVPVGLELRWCSPSSPFSLSFVATGQIESGSDFYLSSGLCVGVRP